MSKTKFESIAREYIRRDGLDDLLKWIESTDFYVAPASTRYHGCYVYGLVTHSLRVYDQLRMLARVYDCDASDESIAIVSV